MSEDKPVSHENEKLFSDNPLMEKLREEGIGHLNSLENVNKAAELIRRQKFTIEELIESEFCPYFPTNLEYKDFNGFSRKGIKDVARIIGENLPSLRKKGLLHTWIVGSGAVGLSHTGKYGVYKKRVVDVGYAYRRAPIEIGDIDVNVLVRSEQYDDCVDALNETSSRYRKEGLLQTPTESSISFYFIPFEEELAKLRERDEEKMKIYSFVTHVLWSQTNWNIHEDVTGSHKLLSNVALERVTRNNVIRDFFFNNAADRWAHGRYKMLIKLGYYRYIYAPAQDIPTLFSSSKRVKAKRRNGYFEI